MKINILHANAGYGHRKVAEIIHGEFLDRGVQPGEICVEDALDYTPAWFRAGYPAIYYYSVKHTPKVWGGSYEFLDKPAGSRMLAPVRTFGNRFVGNRLIRHIGKQKPPVIICTHFFSAELLSRAKREGKIDAHLITVITDFYPHDFWVNRGTDRYWVMSDEGKTDLIRRGVPEELITAGGIPVGKDFLPKGNAEEVLSAHGFEAGKFTLLFTSGSFGLGPTEEILANMDSFSDKIQVFVVCGNNRELQDRLKQKDFPFKTRVFGFVDFMPDLMEASDLMIAKSGGSTTCESLAKGIPMIVLRPIPGQETRNASLLKKRNASFFIEEPGEIRTVLKAIFDYPNVLIDKKKAMNSLAKPHAARDLASYALHEIDVRKKHR